MSDTPSIDMEIEPIDRPQAVRILESLRLGSNCMDGASFFSAGRMLLVQAATEIFEDVEIANNSVVRCLKGRYGHGKTHFFARLIELAHSKNWVTSYVQISGKGQGAELHKFNEIYSAILNNCLTRDIVEQEGGKVSPGRVSGWKWILERWYSALIKQAGGREGGDVPILVLNNVIEQNISRIREKWGLHGSFAEALQTYALCKASGDQERVRLLLDWFRGEDVHSRGGNVRAWLRSEGIREPISRKNAKEMLRSLSTFLRYLGYGGVLILLDEVENVLLETPTARRAAYTILRELVDNVDDRHGMIRTVFYLSGTPDLFDSEKGITEYEALATRLLPPPSAYKDNPAASVIDLSAFPLSQTEMMEIAGNINLLHAAAKRRQTSPDMTDQLSILLKREQDRNPDLSARGWVRAVIDWLDGLPR